MALAYRKPINYMVKDAMLRYFPTCERRLAGMNPDVAN